MSFATFPLWLAIAGVPVLAALLFALQRLRARRRVVRLPAAALWQQAARTAPVRVLGRRFRYWLAYLLALAIALLLWFAAAHPVAAPPAGVATQLFYFDATAALTPPGETAKAARALLADVRAAPAERRRVVLGDATATLLLAPGESVSLLSARLDRVTAAAQPSTFATWLAQVPQGATVHYYGGWPIARDARRATLRYGHLAAAVPGNRGIVALGATPAASGRWGVADVLVALDRPLDDDLRFTLDGRPFAPARIERGGARVTLRDVPATGAVLAVALPRGDGFPADDRAELRLPDRRPIRVAVTATVPAVVRATLAADDAFTLVAPADAQVMVRGVGEAVRPDLPALLLTVPQEQAAAFVFAGPDERARGDLANRLDDLGLSAIDPVALAARSGRAIGVDVQDAPRRSVAVWRDLLTGRFADSATMPPFVSRSLRWLVGDDHWLPYAKAGAPLPDQSRLYGLATQAPAAATPRSLTDASVTRAVADAASRPAIAAATGRAIPDLFFTLLLAAALILLAGEWWLFQRGRMP